MRAEGRKDARGQIWVPWRRLVAAPQLATEVAVPRGHSILVGRSDRGRTGVPQPVLEGCAHERADGQCERAFPQAADARTIFERQGRARDLNFRLALLRRDAWCGRQCSRVSPTHRGARQPSSTRTAHLYAEAKKELGQGLNVRRPRLQQDAWQSREFRKQAPQHRNVLHGVQGPVCEALQNRRDLRGQLDEATGHWRVTAELTHHAAEVLSRQHLRARLWVGPAKSACTDQAGGVGLALGSVEERLQE